MKKPSRRFVIVAPQNRLRIWWRDDGGLKFLTEAEAVKWCDGLGYYVCELVPRPKLGNLRKRRQRK